MSPFFNGTKNVALIRQKTKKLIYYEKIKIGGEHEFPKNYSIKRRI